MKYCIQSNYRTYPYKHTVKHFVVLRLQLCIFTCFIIKAYFVDTHLNCPDESRKFKWVPAAYAFIVYWSNSNEFQEHMLLTFTTLWAFSTDGNFSYFSQKTGIWHFMQIVSSGDNLHEMSNPVFLEKLEKYFKMSSAENSTQSAKS